MTTSVAPASTSAADLSADHDRARARAAVLAEHARHGHFDATAAYGAGYADAHRGRSTFHDVALGVAAAYLTILEEYR